MNRRAFITSVTAFAALRHSSLALEQRPGAEVEIITKEAVGGATATVSIPKEVAVAFAYDSGNEAERYHAFCTKYVSKDFPRPKLQLGLELGVKQKAEGTLEARGGFVMPPQARLFVNGVTTGNFHFDEAGTLLKTRIEKPVKVPVPKEAGAVKEVVLGTWQIKQADGGVRTLLWKCFVARSGEAILNHVKLAPGRAWTFDVPTAASLNVRP